MVADDENDRAARLAAEAADWLVRLDSGRLTQTEQQAFEVWRGQSPAHRAAYAEMESIWRDASQLDDRRAGRTRSAPADRNPPPAIGLGRTREAYPSHLAPRAHRRKRSMLFGLAAALTLTMIIIPKLVTIMRADFRTAVGETEKITLSDGSTAWLNSDTAVAIDLSPAARDVELLQGEALFDVASDAQRPFRVIADDGASVALGTVFNVKQTADKIVTTVIEGRVTVSYPVNTARNETVTLARGHQVSYTSQEGIGKFKAVDLPAVTAWRRGKLIFEGKPVGEVVAELDRYHRGRIAIIDPAIRDLRVNGVFKISDPLNAINVLKNSLGLQATRLTSYLILLHR